MKRALPTSSFKGFIKDAEMPQNFTSIFFEKLPAMSLSDFGIRAAVATPGATPRRDNSAFHYLLSILKNPGFGSLEDFLFIYFFFFEKKNGIVHFTDIKIK